MADCVGLLPLHRAVATNPLMALALGRVLAFSTLRLAVSSERWAGKERYAHVENADVQIS